MSDLYPEIYKGKDSNEGLDYETLEILSIYFAVINQDNQTINWNDFIIFCQIRNFSNFSELSDLMLTIRNIYNYNIKNKDKKVKEIKAKQAASTALLNKKFNNL